MKTKDQSTAAQLVSNLGSYTKYQIDNSDAIKQAFTLGLWYGSLPDYVLLGIDRTHWWQHAKELGEPMEYSDPYPNLMRFSFFSETGDSWHECYRDLRRLGWERLKVHREGGVLTYLLKNWDETKPSEFCQIHLVLSISIKTCKQVQVGTELKEVPIIKTVCEDLVEVDEDPKYAIEPELPPPAPPAPESMELLGISGIEGETSSAEVIPLVVIDDIEELNRRRSIAKSEFEDRAAEAFQDAADSYLPDSDPAIENDDNTDSTPF